MPAPAMPVTMRGDGRGTKIHVSKGPVRHFAGKGDDEDVDTDQDDEGDDINEGSNEYERHDKSAATQEAFKPLANLDLTNIKSAQNGEGGHLNEARQLKGVADDAKTESEYETDAEESGSEEDDEEEEESVEEAPRRVLPKPTFISKSRRETAATTTSNQTQTDKTNGSVLHEKQSDIDLDEQQGRRLAARKLLEHSIRAESASASAAANTIDSQDAIDDTDVLDDDKAFQAWKLRELLRLKRDRDALEAKERERETLDARMAEPESVRIAEAEAERRAKVERKRAEREENGGGAAHAGAAQRHHHRGAFYQDDPVVQRRLEGVVENTGTGQGLRGAVKRQGLLSQDTSRDSLWQQQQPQHNRDKYGKRDFHGVGGGRNERQDEKRQRA